MAAQRPNEGKVPNRWVGTQSGDYAAFFGPPGLLGDFPTPGFCAVLCRDAAAACALCTAASAARTSDSRAVIDWRPSARSTGAKPRQASRP